MQRSLEETLDWGNNILYLQKDTLLFRIESNKNEIEKQHKYFAYFYPEFISGYKKNKTAWKNRCSDDNSQIEFYLLTNEIPLLRLPINNYTYDDPDEKDMEYFNNLKTFASNKNLSKKEYECFIASLEHTFNIPDEEREFQNKDCSEIDGKKIRQNNPDYVLDDIFDKLGFNGWIRLSYEETYKSVEEVLLTRTGRNRQFIKLLETFECRVLSQDLPNLFILKDEDDHFLENYIQPPIITKKLVKRKRVTTKKHKMDITSKMLINIGNNDDNHICSKIYYNFKTNNFYCNICNNKI